MWDMKPDAPDGIRSQFQPIDTVVPGIQICDQMPRIARHTDKMAIIRSYTHPSNTHEVGVYHTLTGKINNTLAVPRNKRNRNDFPNTGAVVSYFSPPQAMPASVTIPRPIGHDGVIYAGTYAGFLGAQHDPMELKPPGEVNEPPPHSLELLDGDRRARGCKPGSACSSCSKSTTASCRNAARKEPPRAWISFANRRFAC